MAFVVKDRVKETSTTQGTGTFTLDGAATGFASFAAIGNGNTTYYTITGGSEWEVGIGIYTSSGTTLSRDTVLASSNNGNLVNFSAGPKDVFVVYPAGRAVIVNGSTIEVPNSAVLPVASGGTGSATAAFSGANISGLNASNVSSGILAVAQGGTGSATASFSGANITSLNASNVTSGVLAVAQGGTGSATASFSGANITSLNASNVSTGILAIANGGTGSADATFSGANITSLNASNISTGTIANARTTGSSANGAATLVLRGASGEFSAGAITASNVSGEGSGLTALNASNISTGTIANARTTASASNGASTIVARDASGNFAAAAITGTSFSGSGASLTSLNADAISSGTIANARTTGASTNGASTLVLRDASGDFTGRNVSATNFIGTLNGSGANVTSINASNISTGTLGVARGGTGAATLTANNVILGNGTSAVLFVAPGTNGNVLTSNGTTWVSQAAGGGFAAGTVMLFAQTAAPTGWTKNTTTGDNSALRVVTGTASSGGSVAFTTAFASQTPTITISAISGTAGATTLTTPQIPSHTHPLPFSSNSNTSGPKFNLSANDRDPVSTGATGGDGSHNHPFSFTSGTATSSAINLAVQYIDVIRATKD